MIRFILARLAGLVAVLLFISIFTFLIMHDVPGGPWNPGQRGLTDSQIAALEARYGLDKPLHEQYLTWLSGAIRFDFGKSFQHPDESVVDVIKRTWPVTMHLGGMALLLAFSIGLPLGIVAAIKHNTIVDYIATLLSIVGLVTPHFVWAILFILLFAMVLKWLPTGGWDEPKQWIMPVVVYSLAPMAIIARYVRAAVLEAIQADYVRTARAKGLPERLVITRHVLRNALIPLLTVLGPIIPDMLTGSMFVEAIFRVPGLGKYWVTSTTARDYTMILGLTSLWAVLIAITYLVTDILYTIADPRIRYR
jgi:ABC-type dipeptide/oligopeptide/nickel transport system permease component